LSHKSKNGKGSWIRLDLATLELTTSGEVLPSFHINPFPSKGSYRAQWVEIVVLTMLSVELALGLLFRPHAWLSAVRITVLALAALCLALFTTALILRQFALPPEPDVWSTTTPDTRGAANYMNARILDSVAFYVAVVKLILVITCLPGVSCALCARRASPRAVAEPHERTPSPHRADAEAPTTLAPSPLPDRCLASASPSRAELCASRPPQSALSWPSSPCFASPMPS